MTCPQLFQRGSTLDDVVLTLYQQLYCNGSIVYTTNPCKASLSNGPAKSVERVCHLNNLFTTLWEENTDLEYNMACQAHPIVVFYIYKLWLLWKEILWNDTVLGSFCPLGVVYWRPQPFGMWQIFKHLKILEQILTRQKVIIS